MTFDARYYRARVERLLERRSKKAALRSDMMRRVQRQKLAAGAAKLPKDLEKLSQHLGIREIRCVPLSMNGRLFRSDRGLVIEVNERLDDFRGRQTIAHELA